MKVRCLRIIVDDGHSKPDLSVKWDDLGPKSGAFVHAVPGEVGEVVHVEPNGSGVFSAAWPRGYSCAAINTDGEMEPV